MGDSVREFLKIEDDPRVVRFQSAVSAPFGAINCKFEFPAASDDNFLLLHRYVLSLNWSLIR